jgi:Fe(3+) dicitrate transport protein
MMAVAVRGKVVDAERTPVAFANVFILENGWGTSTGLSGEFSIHGLAQGQYSLRITAVGFEAYNAPLIITEGTIPALDIQLVEATYGMPQVEVVGMRNQAMKKLPGSAAVIDRRELELISPVSGNEVFRRIPGIHVVDEEGAGLRTNIGIRGLDPDRSRTVLVLEDGIPVSLNPYGEPEMYYTPSMDRMSGVEVIKGSGQIAYGPRTIGGVINYITPDPPAEEEVQLNLQGGQGGYFSGLVSYGNTVGNAGMYISYMRRQADDLMGAQYRVNDLTAKFKLILNEKSSLGLKLGVYDETSNSTYIGLTQPMFDGGDDDFVRMAPDDRLDVRRFSLSATHKYQISERTALKTTAFGYTTSRDWRRQDFSSSPTASNQTGVIWGDTTIAGGAVFMRNGTGNRNRAFLVGGVETKLSHSYAFAYKSSVDAGVRLQYEMADEQRINGSFPQAESGALVADEQRTGNAQSAFVENKTWITEKFLVTAGVRFENYNFEREIFRGNYGGSITDTSVVGTSTVTEVIPGLGVNYSLNEKVDLFAGVHKGFAPPILADAITTAGEVYELDAELSWNFEAGIRSVIARGVHLDVTGFYMDFSNQVIPVSESSGGTGSGLVNGGTTVHRGAEAALVVGFGEVFELPFRLNLDVNATYIDAFFSGDRFVGSDADAINIEGNRTPYAPEFLLSSALTFETSKGFGLRFAGTYVSDQFTDPANSIIPTANGRNGQIPSYFLMDATARYTVAKWNTTFSLSCKNLTDERYMVSRRPQGIRVGLPRFISAGVTARF